MSKEERLDKAYLLRMHWQSVNRKRVLGAMDEYSKQHAIEFYKWVKEQPTFFFGVESEAVYKLFLKSKTTPNE